MLSSALVFRKIPRFETVAVQKLQDPRTTRSGLQFDNMFKTNTVLKNNVLSKDNSLHERGEQDQSCDRSDFGTSISDEKQQ